MHTAGGDVDGEAGGPGLAEHPGKSSRKGMKTLSQAIFYLFLVIQRRIYLGMPNG
jgi:hypothetical protein